MRRFILSLTILFAAVPAATAAQEEPEALQVDTGRAASGWDSPRALDLIARARTRRAQPVADSLLQNYRARAEGFVYFYLDRRANDERTLVRVNQVALELYWRQPDEARQRIVGTRDASPLPNTQRYHLDHLTMVQNGFGDVIRMGDGDEVRDVPHPAAARAEAIYEYRLSDSLEIRIPSLPEPIRVYEVQVRPRTFDRSALVGTLFIDRATADIVRMTFTFTPASYVDRRLDYINVSLDNGLWEGRYWLPNEQTVEIRRQLPELDFAVGAVIRGRMRIIDYDLNAGVPDSVFRRRSVYALPEEQRETHAFESDLFAGISEEGLAQPESLADLRREASEMLGRRMLSGLPSLRLYLPSVSSAIRYNRADGLYLGLGHTYASGPRFRLDALAGYGFASQKPSLLLRASYSPSEWRVSSTLFTRELRDVGLVPGLPGVLNTLSAAWNATDYLDPWYADGLRLAYSRTVALRYGFTASAAFENQRSATRAQDHAVIGGDAFRAVRAIDDGTEVSVTAELARPLPSGEKVAWGGAVALSAARLDPSAAGAGAMHYLEPSLRMEYLRSTTSHDRELRLRATGRMILGDSPSQRLLLIGGRGTLPGYGYRRFSGTRAAVADAELTQHVRWPWLGIRATVATGITGGAVTGDFAAGSEPADGLRSSVGVGASLFWDTLKIDRVRGLDGGEWKWHVSFTRTLDDIG